MCAEKESTQRRSLAWTFTANALTSIEECVLSARRRRPSDNWAASVVGPVPVVTVLGAVSKSGHCGGTVGRHSGHDDRIMCHRNSDSGNGISVLIYNRYFERNFIASVNGSVDV